MPAVRYTLENRFYGTRKLETFYRSKQEVNKLAYNRVVRVNQVPRCHWLRMREYNLTKPIMRGWHLIRNDEKESFKDIWFNQGGFESFLAYYLKGRFKDAFCLSAESSYVLHMKGHVPRDTHVMMLFGGSTLLELSFNCWLSLYVEKLRFPIDIESVNNLRAMTLPLALCRIGPNAIKRNPQLYEQALNRFKSPDPIIDVIVRYQYASAGHRLLGAYKQLGRKDTANYVQRTLKSEGFPLRPIFPFPNDYYSFNI